MSYNRLIHDYLDGELDQTGEETLFANLSGNAELRHDFNMHVKLNNLALMDMQRLTVPSDVTGALFGRLGISAPGVGVLTPVSSNENGFVRKYAGFLMLLLLLFTAGTSVYLLNENNALRGLLGSLSGKQKAIPVIESYSDNSQGNAVESNSSDMSGSVALSDNVQNSQSNGAVIRNYTNSSSSAKSNNSSNSGINSNDRESSNGSGILAGATDENAGIFAKIMTITFGSYENNFNIRDNDIKNISGNSRNLNSRMIGSNGNDGFMYNPANLYELNLPVWSIQIRRTSPQNSYPPVTVGDEADFMTDNSIGVWYHRWQDWSVGVERGSEIFSQEFTSDNLNYSQAPMLIWYGASLRYNPKEWIIPYTLNPYIMQTVAYTKVGPLSKSQAGLTVTIFEPLTFFGGIEYSWLLYPSDGKLYNSGKIGFTGGININFR